MRRMPQSAIIFLVGTLSLAGIPLFGGFLSKEEILGAVWAGGMTGPFVILLVVAFLTAFYMFRVVFLAFFATPAAHDTHPHDPPMTMALPLWILAVLSFGIGLYFTVAGPALPFGPAEAEFQGPTWLMPIAVGSAVGGILLAWLTYQRRIIDAGALAAACGPLRYAAMRRFWIDDVIEAAYGVVLLGFSRAIGWFDRYVVDGVLNVVSAWTLTSGDDLRTMQTGRVQDYVYGVAVGLMILLLWARWALA